MSAFTEFDSFERLKGTTYVLTKPLNWDLHFKGSGQVFQAEAGTEFDISVPTYMRWALSPHDRAILPAACVHDELLKRGYDPAFSAFEFLKAIRARSHNERRSKYILIGVLWWTM